MKAFNSSNIEDIYDNIIQNFMKIKLTHKEEVKLTPIKDPVKKEGEAKSTKIKLEAIKRQSSKIQKKATSKRIKEDKGWSFNDALVKARAKKNK